MRTSRPLFLLGAIAAASASLAAPVDTSAWKCATCPYEKAASATVEVGAGHVDKQSSRYSDYTGLDKGSHAVLDANGRMRGESGLYGSLRASDLGLDSRALAGEIGQEGLFGLRLAYDELPRHLSNAASTPFIGVGGPVLTLPTTTLQPVELGFKRKRADAGLSFQAGANWTLRMNLRQDVREGTRPGAGSFFADAAELPLPVDQVTNQFELAAIYASRELQASVGYHVSTFDNAQTALTWTNPFPPVLGGTTGQLALAPDNQLHQITASLGYAFAPKVRGSADVAFGRLKQDEAFLAPTLNAGLAGTLAPLPTQSLQGQIETFNANLKLTAAIFDPLRLSASYGRDTRENDTPRLSFPAVATDMFAYATPRTNRPYGFWQDRFKLVADYRAESGMKASVGVEKDYRERAYQEAVQTRESTLWGRIAAQPFDELSLAFKLSHAQRKHSPYGVATWLESPQNPLMRKYNLADRRRESASGRVDIAISETVNLGLGAEFASDKYAQSAVGLIQARSMNLGADLSVALGESTQVNAYIQADRVHSRQAGSQAFAQADWTARNEDRFELMGLGLRHAIIADTLDVGADYTYSRSRSLVSVDTGVSSTPRFPAATVAQDSLKVHATYKLQDNLWLTGSFAYETYEAKDWRIDGVLPATVGELLSFGQQSPQYDISVLRLAVRYRF